MHDWQTCTDDECQECTDLVHDGIVMACDSCGKPGLVDAGALSWRVMDGGSVLCITCFEGQGELDAWGKT